MRGKLQCDNEWKSQDGSWYRSGTTQYKWEQNKSHLKKHCPWNKINRISENFKVLRKYIDFPDNLKIK